jgi:hypothetical protein
MRSRDATLRARLIQKALADKRPSEQSEKEKPIPEEDRWDRYDAFCTAHGAAQYGNSRDAMKRGASNE